MSKGAIVVVDDDAAIRDLVQMALADEGYTVSVWGEGATLPPARAQQADLILLDLSLATAARGALVERLRVDPATARIPLIGFSARADGAVLVAQMRLDDLLVKPFDLDDLFALVARWVAEGRDQRALRAC